MSRKSFDQSISDKLNGFKPDETGKDWFGMLEKLEAADVNTTTLLPTDASSFDQVVREKLLEHSFSPKSEHWAALADKLDGPADETIIPLATALGAATFDQNVREKIGEYQSVFDPTHWNIFESRLNNLINFRNRYGQLKVIESVMMICMLLFFVQYLPLNSPKDHDDTVPPQQQPIAGTFPEQKSVGSALDEDTLNEKELVASDANVQESDADTPDLEAQHLQSPMSSEKVSELGVDYASVLGPQYEAFTQNQESSTLNQTELPVIPILPGKQQVSPITTQDDRIFSASIMQRNKDRWDDLPIVASRPFSTLKSSRYQLNIPIFPLKKKATLRLGSIHSIDVNHIITPPNYELDRYSEKRKNALGYSTGFTIGLEKGRWEIETGLLYVSKNYEPVPVLFVKSGNFKDGYRAEGIKYSALDLFQVPLNGKFNFVYKNKWRAYVLGGISLNTAFLTNYFKADQEAFAGGNFNPGPVIGGAPIGQGQIVNENNQQETFGGIFEGGPFERNSYLTLNVGFGIERYFNERFSVFAQPTYQSAFTYFNPILNNGIGPDNDRINNFSGFLGLKMRFNR